MLRLFRLKTLTTVVLALAVSDAPMGQAPARVGERFEAEVDGIFTRYDSTATPGCAVAVIDAGDVVFRKAYGMANISLGVPMTPAVSFWIPYSEARVFTGLAVAMLARDRRISLDDPIRRHVPELPEYAGAVTVRQLVHHASGLADYGWLAGLGWQLGDHLSEDEFFRMLARWGRLGFEPGQDEMYSNTDYALLKILVERVTGGSLHGYLAEHVLLPLGMSTTRVGADQATVLAGHALFYERDGDSYRTLLHYRSSPVGGISVTSSVDDMARWARALSDPSSGFDALLASLNGLEQGDGGFLYGVYASTHGGQRSVEYRGVGGYVYLLRVPDEELAVVTLCNAYQGMDEYGSAVARLYMDGGASAGHAPAPTPATATDMNASVEVSADELQSYAGEYRDPNDQRRRLRMDVPDGVLHVTTPDGIARASRPLGAGRFEFQVAPQVLLQVAFETANAAPATAVQVSVNGEPDGNPLQRWVEWTPTAEALRDYPGTYAGVDVDGTLYVTVEDGRVMIAGRGLPTTEMPPESEDAFEFPDAVVRFHRDDSGRVSHLTVNARRVQGMRYTRVSG